MVRPLDAALVSMQQKKTHLKINFSHYHINKRRNIHINNIYYERELLIFASGFCRYNPLSRLLLEHKNIFKYTL